MKTVRLDHLTPGARAIIQDIVGGGPLVRRLMDLGLVPGTPVHYVRSAPLGDPLELVVRGTHLSLRRSEAARVHVEPV
ncbi:MAG: ferrous iron transport protein A [Candidatus Krumholzibacteria bacterium]|nr:ferrous iron transport protein A [Candidatus Krumholzibacteria bacterium]MDH4335991.1 ferrous iron transport protein A [Candidatus Krumholzibacteria bacterium]MDH5268433.1 ferrous iron transport protein A [Candidatus Krumholzibacteria bacterium]MDH5626940.1 ferrous iron transport protein A [Candidatus Krumholzibacteria bacterium]